MEEIQLKLAASVNGLVGTYVIDGTSTEEEEGEFARPDFGSVNDPLHDAMIDLEDTLNTVINTDVHVGSVCLGMEEAGMSVDGEKIAFPIPADVAESLYKKFESSLVGVEGQGAVLDSAIRSSHEAPANLLELSEGLASFNFPQEMRRIHELLCPSAVSLRAEPYKLILYAKGDFFKPHRDSMSSPDMFGSISLLLPVIKNETPKNEDGKQENEEGHGSERRGAKSHKNKTATVKARGQLVFYVGRHASDEESGESGSTDTGDYYNDYGETAQFARVVDLPNFSSTAMTDGAITISYAAWTGDVLHEVRPVQSGHRAVLIYRLYKVGQKISYIPATVRDDVTTRIASVMQMMVSMKPQKYRFLGVTLRHAYPPAGLKPEFLKGIDAVLYSIASATKRCLLFTAHELREGSYRQAHVRTRKTVTHPVFLTTNSKLEELCCVEERTFRKMCRSYMAFINTAFISLGYGAVAGGGYVYGNVPCLTDWWYRSAVLIITQEPSLWKRRKNLLLATMKGHAPLSKLQSNVELMKIVASFL